jgi:hypothetical protein
VQSLSLVSDISVISMLPALRNNESPHVNGGAGELEREGCIGRHVWRLPLPHNLFCRESLYSPIPRLGLWPQSMILAHLVVGQLIPFGMQNRTFGPNLAAIIGSLFQ